jgi:hypothetical protein
MSTASFAGTTFWNDAQTGVGRPFSVGSGRRINWALEQLPRGTGLVAKNLGIIPASRQYGFEFNLTSAERATKETLLDGLKGSYGDFIFRGTTYTGCILMSYEPTFLDWVEVSGTMKERTLFLISILQLQ